MVVILRLMRQCGKDYIPTRADIALAFDIQEAYHLDGGSQVFSRIGYRIRG